MSLVNKIKRAIFVAERVSAVADRVKLGAQRAKTLVELARDRKEAGLCPSCGKPSSTPPMAQGLCEVCLGKLAAGVLENADLFTVPK